MSHSLNDVVENSSSSNDPTTLICNIEIIESPSCGQQNGMLEAFVEGGTPPYTYDWNTGEADVIIGGVGAGMYTLRVTDSTGCISECSTSFLTALAPQCQINVVIEPSCNQNNGEIEVVTIGGSEPFTYLWADGSASNQLQNVSNGTYHVTVEDNVGCTSACEIILSSKKCHTIHIVNN